MPTQATDAQARRFGTRAILLTAGLALVAIPFLLLVLLVEDRSPLLRDLDTGPRDALHSYALDHRWFVSLMRLLSDSGTTTAWLVIFVPVVAWLLWRRSPRRALFVVSTVVLSSVLNNLVKVAVHRTRPVLANPVASAGGASFPSGHAQAALVGYGVLVLICGPLLRRPWRRLLFVVAAVMVLAIGLSRVALGVHYVSDVLAGYVLGAAWLAAMTGAFRAWQHEAPRARRVADHAGAALGP